MKKIKVPAELAGKDLFQWLKQNKELLIVQKKALPKLGAGFGFDARLTTVLTSKAVARKEFSLVAPVATEQGVLKVIAVINTTNFMDTALDVHMPGLWAKSLSDNKMLMHLQEHDMAFAKIIADGKDLKAYTKAYSWKELGYDYKGKTEALVFESTVRKARNPFMYDQYEKGYVKNHSVFMSYVKMVLCINQPDDTDYGAEYEAWQKYYPEVANKETADSRGYFWAILEAKAIEGSAVPVGANVVTPTLSVDAPKSEPPVGTPKFNIPKIGLPEKGQGLGKNFHLKLKLK